MDKGFMHVFFDLGDPTKACLLFERNRCWRLISWDLRTDAIERGQWMVRAEIMWKNCALYHGLFVCNYYQAGEQQSISRAPFFTPLIQLSRCHEAELRLIKDANSPPFRVALWERKHETNLNCNRLQQHASSELLITVPWEFEDVDSPQLVPVTGPTFSSGSTGAPSSGYHLDRYLRLEKARLTVGDVVIVDMTGVAFRPIRVPTGYFGLPAESVAI